jgi:hypothetical protein
MVTARDEMQLGAGVTLHRVVWMHGCRRVEALVLLWLLTLRFVVQDIYSGEASQSP